MFFTCPHSQELSPKKVGPPSDWPAPAVTDKVPCSRAISQAMRPLIKPFSLSHFPMLLISLDLLDVSPQSTYCTPSLPPKAGKSLKECNSDQAFSHPWDCTLYLICVGHFSRIYSLAKTQTHFLAESSCCDWKVFTQTDKSFIYSQSLWQLRAFVWSPQCQQTDRVKNGFEISASSTQWDQVHAHLLNFLKPRYIYIHFPLFVLTFQSDQALHTAGFPTFWVEQHQCATVVWSLMLQ